MRLLDDKKRRFEHWWPVGAQKFWQAKDGTLAELSDGILRRKQVKNRKIGGARKAHFFELGGPWTHSFEGLFSECDREIPKEFSYAEEFVRKARFPYWGLLRSVLDRPMGADRIERRAVLTNLSQDRIDKIALLVLSIVLRSPYFRYKKSHMPKGFGGGQDLEIGKANIQNFFRLAQEAHQVGTMRTSAVFLRVCGMSEFVFGDGFYETCLENFSSLRRSEQMWVPSPRGELIFPLTPKMGVIFKFGSDSPFCAVVDVLDIEVQELNMVTRLCSRKNLYFRSKGISAPEKLAATEFRTATFGESSFPGAIMSFVRQTAGEVHQSLVR